MLGLAARLAGAEAQPSTPRAATATNSVAVQSLTIRDCIERALANNLDVKLERLNPSIRYWGIVRERSAFEPAFSGAAAYTDSTESLDPERAAALGFNSLESQRLRAQAGVGGELPTGTQYGVAGLDTRTEGTLTADSIHVGNVAVTLTQPLLRDFWLGPNTAALRVARQDETIAQEVFAQQVMTVVSGVQDAYHELVFAIEDHRAKREDLGRAQALLAENRRRLEIGVLSPLDVTQAEAGVAEREEAVIVTERAIQDRENVLKRLISQDVTELRGVRLVPVETPPVRPVVMDLANSISRALESRPEYLQELHNVERQNILVAYNRNQLWPQVDLEGSYGLNGSGGTFGRLTDDVTSGDSPAWSVGLVVTVPLGNQQARANYQTARLESEKALLNLKRVEQDILVEVDNAIGRVETNWKRIDATTAAVRLADESLQAEIQKLRAGTSTSFLVLEAQSRLAETQAADIRARADYHISLVELARVEGSTLQDHGIELEEE